MESGGRVGELAISNGLVDLLIERGKLDATHRQRLFALRAASGESDPVILTRLGLVSEPDMAEALAAHLGLAFYRAEDYPTLPLLAERITAAFLRRSRVMPVAERPDALVLAMADPTDRFAIEAVQLLIGKKVLPAVALPGELERAVERLYGLGREANANEAAASTDALASPDDVERLKDLASEAPVIRLVNAIVTQAVLARASDIHIEPFEDRLKLRLRIDGALREIEPPQKRLHAPVCTRIKVMAGLDIGERRLPQDGRCRVSVQGRDIDIRVSIVPTLHGESVVLRLLDKARAPLDLGRLGFGTGLEIGIRELLSLPNGIILVTGPTGSGKTTTLYAALELLNRPERNIVTAEDPVEYQIPGVNQIQVKPQIGLTFAHILRSVLRHDPDVLMIGEIRDLETAAIAVQAALTGHLVLSTVHTNDAVGTVTRLMDMGVEDYLLTASLRAVLAQRLVRTLCHACRRPRQIPAARAAGWGLGDRAIEAWEPVGCPACNGTGYIGRTAIAELLPMNEEIRGLILGRADPVVFRAAARRAGMAGLRDDGLAKAVAGQTSIEEVIRETGAA